MPEQPGLPVPTPPAPAPAAPAAPSVDLSGVQDTLKQLGDAISGITERLDEFEESYQPPTPAAPAAPQPKWKPKTWDEFPGMAAQVARQVVVDMFHENEELDKQEREKADQLQASIDKEFDTQLVTLESGGRIPGVTNPNDPNDPGRVARKELFGLGILYKSPDLMAMADLREQLAAGGMRFDPESKKIVRGAAPRPAATPFAQAAPVGSSARSTGFQGKPTYKEIHGVSMDEMVRRFNEGA